MDSLTIHLIIIQLFCLIVLINKRKLRLSSFTEFNTIVNKPLNPKSHTTQILEKLFKNPIKSELNSLELNEFIEIDTKSFDTQWQYRARFIQDFNLLLEREFNIPSAITKKVDPLDKRYYLYTFSQAIFRNPKIQKFLSK